MTNVKNLPRHRVEKLDAIQTTVSIEKKHKYFLESHNVNLSALVRDTLDNIMGQFLKSNKENKK